jgi:hypothetical protein
VTTAVPSTAHKRRISKGIPSNERPNAPEEVQEDPKAEARGKARKAPARVLAHANLSASSRLCNCATSSANRRSDSQLAHSFSSNQA